jgi:hypothetical protein
MMKKLILILITIAFTIPVKAQWSTNPTENNQFVFESAYDWDSRLLSDGSYVIYYNRPAGNLPTGLGDTAFFLKHVLMRYNADGTPAWEAPKVIANTPNKSFTMYNEYLFIDGNDNIMVTVPDCRYDTFGVVYPSGLYNWYHMNLSLHKVNKDGESLWGENGISIDKTPHDLVALTNAIALENGDVIVTYAQQDIGSSSLVTKIARLDRETGAVIWLKDLLGKNGTNVSNARLVNGGDNTFIAVYGTIAAQKLDFDGDVVWDHTVVYDKGGFPAQGIHLNIKVLPVERGAFISWSADPDGDQFEDAYCTYVNKDGQLIFSTGTDGTKIGMTSFIRQFSPIGVYDPVGKSVYYIWREANDNESWNNMRGQRISLMGELVWDPDGIEIAPMLVRRVDYSKISIDDEGNPCFFYLEQEGSFSYTGHAQKRTPAGDSLWSTVFTSSIGEGDEGQKYDKSSLLVLPFYGNQWIALWNDNRPEASGFTDQNYIWGQNITKNGTIGAEITSVEASAKANTGNTHFSVASNPVAGETSFTMKGLKGQKVELSVLNNIGKTVATVFKGTVSSGEDIVAWNPETLAKGIYIAALKTQTGVEAIKLVIK